MSKDFRSKKRNKYEIDRVRPPKKGAKPTHDDSDDFDPRDYVGTTRRPPAEEKEE